MSLANLEPNLESKIKQIYIYIYIYNLSPFKCSVYIVVCVCDNNLSSLCEPMRL